MLSEYYLYHQVPEKMEGNILYPLNQLRFQMPETYTSHITKYLGRERITERIIPRIECLWNDVLFFIAIDPFDFQKVFERHGRGNVPRDFFKIPARTLSSDQTVIYTPCKEGRTSFPLRIPEEQISSYNPEDLSPYCQMTKATLDHLDTVLGRGDKTFLPYISTPHILYKSTLDISGIEIIRVQKN